MKNVLFEKMNINNTALMIIDMVNFCAHEKYELKKYGVTYRNIRKMASKLDDFVNYWRKEVGGQVIIVKSVPWTEKHLPKNIIELYEDSGVSFYTKDKSGFAEECYGVSPAQDDLVIIKNTYSAFSAPKLPRELKKRGIQYFGAVAKYPICLFSLNFGKFP